MFESTPLSFPCVHIFGYLAHGCTLFTTLFGVSDTRRWQNYIGQEEAQDKTLGYFAKWFQALFLRTLLLSKVPQGGV
jgi:hypothetical protein